MLYIDKNKRSILAEKYRQLKSSIQYAAIDKEMKVIVVTSSEVGEGKSTVSANLAYILGSGGKKVVLVDCDLRKPSVHRIFGISNEAGLVDFLVKKNGMDDILKKYNSELDIITVGKIPPNPADIVSSKAMEEFINYLKGIYDYVIIDTPPVRMIVDGTILADKADGTVFVVRAEFAKEEFIKAGFNELKKTRANILGCVLNSVDMKIKEKNYGDYFGKNK